MDASAHQKVLLFLPNGSEDLEVVALIDTCGWTSYRPDLPHVTVTTAGRHPQIRGRFGTVFTPQLQLHEVRPEDYSAIVIPGGFDSHGYREDAYDPSLRDHFRTIHGGGGWILTMCVGILPVAEAGLLNRKRATTYRFGRSEDRLARLRELGAVTTEGPIECDDRIISCSGPAYAVQASQLLLRNLIGGEATAEIATFMCGHRR
jgi:4-methyl-5(b-hydroxyethyl)-thiazole monophosphate biosynthesis